MGGAKIGKQCQNKAKTGLLAEKLIREAVTRVFIKIGNLKAPDNL
jgi:hypothetical protein